VAFFFARQWKAAETEFRHAVHLKPDFSDAHYNLGHALIQLQDRERAIAEFREAVRFHPDYVPAYSYLGRLLLEADRREEAREALETASRLAPDDDQTQKLLRESE